MPMMYTTSRALRWAALGLLLAACNRKPPAPAPQDEAGAQAKSTAVAAAADKGPAKAGELEDKGEAKAKPDAKPDAKIDAEPGDKTHDVKGVQVTFRKDGSVSLRGKDRWGAEVTSTYESADYLRNALPSLRLSLADGVVEGIEPLVGKAPEKRGNKEARSSRGRRKKKSAADN